MSARALLSWIGAFGLALFAAAGAQANVVSGTLGTATYSVTCPDGCTLLEVPGTPEANIPNPTEANLATYLNGLAGTSFTAAAVTKLSGGDPPINFVVTAPYFILKIDGPNVGYLFFQNNDASPPQTITYTATGTATGISFFAQVPIPAALLLFLTALGGLLGWRRWSGQGGALVPQAA
jgi:hypothetical protein